MEIKPLFSGSLGNAYLLRHGNDYVLLECGVVFNKLWKAILMNGVSMAQIKAVVVSHKHYDHRYSMLEFLKYGFTVFCPESAKPLNDKGGDVRIVKAGDTFSVCDWCEMKAFDVLHDCECLGFMIHDKFNNDLTLFMTDTGYQEFNFGNLSFNNIMIECNHLQKECIRKFKETGDPKYKRQAKYHLSLAGCKKILKSLNLEETEKIYLLHTSKEIGYIDLCKKDIEKTFKKIVIAC